MPQTPKPPTVMVAPSGMSATAWAAESQTLLENWRRRRMTAVAAEARPIMLGPGVTVILRRHADLAGSRKVSIGLLVRCYRPGGAANPRTHACIGFLVTLS